MSKTSNGKTADQNDQKLVIFWHAELNYFLKVLSDHVVGELGVGSFDPY